MFTKARRFLLVPHQFLSVSPTAPLSELTIFFILGEFGHTRPGQTKNLATWVGFLSFMQVTSRRCLQPSKLSLRQVQRPKRVHRLWQRKFDRIRLLILPPLPSHRKQNQQKQRFPSWPTNWLHPQTHSHISLTRVHFTSNPTAFSTSNAHVPCDMPHSGRYGQNIALD